MITFKQYVAEAFNTSFPYTKESELIYKFGDTEVEFEKRKIGRNFHYSIEFTTGNKYSLTGTNSTGDALKIYGTIVKIIIEFFDNNKFDKNDTIGFMAYDKRTLKVYDKFARFLSHKLNADLAKSGNSFKLTGKGHD